jgi:uncharacterized protein
MTESIEQERITPGARMVILIASLAVACGLSLAFTGTVVPTSAAEALVFQSTLLFVVLGSAVLEHKFTRPADSVVNGLMGMVSLITVANVAPPRAWWAVFGYCAAVFVTALVCSVASTDPSITGWRRRIAAATYRPTVVFGRARVLYSVVFLFAIFTFYGVQDPRTGALVVFWGLFLALWPLGVPEILSAFRIRKGGPSSIGRAIRFDSPNLVRVELDPAQIWTAEHPAILQAADGKQQIVVPLYSQLRGEHLLATGLCVPASDLPAEKLTPGHLYPLASVGADSVAEKLGGRSTSALIGFIIEDSSIGQIRFETWRHDLCCDGLLVWCPVGGKRVFYQITEGATREEALEGDRHGFQYGVASQLGELESEAGFVRNHWVPLMNTPVFWDADIAEGPSVQPGDFVYGTLPGTEVPIAGPFLEAMDHHTAILGVTGTGKTELAFDLIRHTVAKGCKVICIDLTDRYRGRIEDLNPVDLSITAALADDLGKKLFDAETGAYGAGQEKKALKLFADKLRTDVAGQLKAFLVSKEQNQKVGLITLNEISNTKATLFITELYMTCLLHCARDHATESPRVLVVVEEAHTVMPEPSTMGLGDHDSRGLVSKIAQIALQGRKYGVGLLVIAQRTATVSKSVLTQCNTVITLNCFDETSLGFLGNVYGAAYTKLIPNLPRLHAVVFGKGVRSERPIVFQIPFDAAKAIPAPKASKSTDHAVEV